MTASNSSAPLPKDDGVRYERVDDLTIHVYVEGLGDTTVRPPSPARVKQREADRANIERLVAWAKREQEIFNARQPQSPQLNEPNDDTHAG
jgi:hypothetical protein